MKDLYQAILERHSVRKYTDKAIPEDVVARLQALIDECNREAGLNMQLVLNEPKAFGSFLTHYGAFRGVKNYLALVAPKGEKQHEILGYYGAKVMLLAQQLGLNSCWVALTYRTVSDAVTIRKGESLESVIALGYGETQGQSHKIKTVEKVAEIVEPRNKYEWYYRGVETALLAPTAINQQKFKFGLTSAGKVTLKKSGIGFYAKMDLGIVRYFFEIGAGKENFEWSEPL